MKVSSRLNQLRLALLLAFAAFASQSHATQAAHPISPLHSGSDEGFDCHFRRIYLVRFGNGHIGHSVIFSIWKTVTTFDVWIASNVKRFYNAFPHQASVKYFYDWRRGDMSRHAPDVFLHSALNVKDSLCHAQPSARGRELSRAS
jgi:hypothetical protein